MAGMEKEIRDRMRELYIYDLYSLRGEIKPLGRTLYPGETVNCFATGIMDGLRRMAAVTASRVIIIGCRPGSAPEFHIIPRAEIVSHAVTKRFFGSSIEFTGRDGVSFKMTNVSRRILELFEWALERPLPNPDS